MGEKMGVMDLILPREVEFFKEMNEQIGIFYEACKVFKEFVENIDSMNEDKVEEYVKKIKALELKGDQIERKIIDHLETTFITPLDREDIHNIAASLDDALDYLHEIAQRIKIYKIRKVNKNVISFANIIVDITFELKNLIASLEKNKYNKEMIAKITSLEREADTLFHNSTAELFTNKTDPIEVIKFKDIYEDLENTVDSVDRIASSIRGIMVKRG